MRSCATASRTSPPPSPGVVPETYRVTLAPGTDPAAAAAELVAGLGLVAAVVGTSLGAVAVRNVATRPAADLVRGE